MRWGWSFAGKSMRKIYMFPHRIEEKIKPAANRTNGGWTRAVQDVSTVTFRLPIVELEAKSISGHLHSPMLLRVRLFNLISTRHSESLFKAPKCRICNYDNNNNVLCLLKNETFPVRELSGMHCCLPKCPLYTAYIHNRFTLRQFVWNLANHNI